MILKRIEIYNTKSFYSQEKIELEDDINVFVGPNAGGKSNLFEIAQAIISNLLLKHITIQANGNRNAAIGNPHRGIPYQLNIDQIDQSIPSSILDRHFKHTDETNSVYLTIFLTENDIHLVKRILDCRATIVRYLSQKVVNSEQITTTMQNWKVDIDFSVFANKEIKLGVYPNVSLNVQIADFTGFPEEQHTSLNQLFEIIQYINLVHELTLLLPDIDISPLTRYFPPQRILNQPPDKQIIDLTGIGNFENNFAKNTNLNKDSSFSFIDSSYQRLCYLTEDKKKNQIAKYKEYLRKYLKITFNIKLLKEMRYKKEYEITYKRISGIPMRLSSGEKEFFNLITGLILTGIKDGIVFIDEPELHLHFQWQEAILSLIRELSGEFHIQFLIVTHSPKLVTKTTLPHLQRVYKEGLYSHVIKTGKDFTSSVEDRDLVQFLTTTNNEKAFFAEKVILVEGTSDLIIFSKMVELLRKETRSDKEVEIIQVASKSNLMKFRTFLNQWKVENFIIADLDYINDIRKNRATFISSKVIRSEMTKFDAEISSIIDFSASKLKEILLDKESLDAKSVIDIISGKSRISKEDFLNKMDQITDYLVKERALQLKKPISLSKELKELLHEIAAKEKLLVLQRGDLEDYFSKKSANKIENALRVADDLSVSDINEEIADFFLSALH